MRADDAARVRTPKPEWAPGMRCALCGQSPTCPQLVDELWSQVWTGAMARGLRAPTCTGAGHRRPIFRCDPRTEEAPGDWHSRTCEMVRGVRELLCMECAEVCLGRELTTDDLESCVANYAHVVMQRRAERVWFGEGVSFAESGDVATCYERGRYEEFMDKAFAARRR